MSDGPELDLHSLFEGANKLADSLERNWTLQAVVAATGVLYLADVGLTTAFAKNLRLEVGILKYALPVIGLYLFVRMGYLVAAFIERRKLLADEVALQAVGQDVESHKKYQKYQKMYNDYSLFSPLSAFVNSKESQPEPTWISLLPFGAIIIFGTAVVIANLALAAYFTYASVATWSRIAAWSSVVGLWVCLLPFFMQIYRNKVVQGASAQKTRLSAVAILSLLALAVSLGLILIIFVPLPKGVAV